MPNLKNNNKQSSSSSQKSIQSEEQHYASVLQAKNQEKKQSKNIDKIQISGEGLKNIAPSRLTRNATKNSTNSKQQIKKRKINSLKDTEQNTKKQQKKRSAAPPQLLTQSSQSVSSRSQKFQSNQQHAAPQQPNQSSRLYIGNLPLQLSQNQIRKLFKKFGNLKLVQLVINAITGKSKGFGFVQYFDIKSAIKAKYELSEHILDGLKIKIQFCKSQ